MMNFQRPNTLNSLNTPMFSIIIINWNGEKYIRRCLESLSKVTYPNFEIIVVDNASQDNSVEIIKDFSSVKLIQNKENLGFAQGNNVGYENSDGDYIYFLNNDTYVEANFLEPIVKVFASPEIGGAQSKIILPLEENRLDNVGAYLTNTGFLYHYGFRKKDEPHYDEQIEIFSVKGAGMCFKREVIEKVACPPKPWHRRDLFDPDFFAYFEETDFCWRVWLAGYKIIFVPESKIYHLLAASFKKIPSSFTLYHNYKNRICTLLKNLEIKNFWLLLWHLKLCKLISALYLFTGKPKLFWAIQKALWWNFVNLRETLRKRKRVQKEIREVSDKELFKKIKRSPPLSYYYYLFRDDLANFVDP